MDLSERHRCSFDYSYKFSVSLKLFQNNELKTKGMTNIHVVALVMGNHVDFEPISSVK